MLEIVEKAKKGDEIAFKMLYDRYYKQAYFYALKICHYNEADAYDATQEAFATIHNQLPKLQNSEYFVAWMSKIVLSKCTKIFRSRKDVYMEDTNLAQLNAQETKRENNPTAYLHEQTDVEIVQRMISDLSPILADALRMIYFEQRSYKEVSKLLNVPVGTVKSRVNQGREHLKQKVEAFEIKEGRKIDFKLEGMLSTGLFLTLLSKIKLAFSTSAAPTVVTLGAVATITIGGYTVYQSFQDNQNINDAASTLIQNEQTTASFPVVHFQGKEITTAKSAYYVIMEWAANDIEIQARKHEDISEILPVIEAIGESNTEYKNMLQNQGWFENFESI